MGQYAIQILSYYGYTNLFTTASPTHHPLLKVLGRDDIQTFDYRSPDVTSQIVKATNGGKDLLVFDCIGSKYGSLEPLSNIASTGSKVAVLLPVIVKDAAEGDEGEPVYAMNPAAEANWKDGVRVRGVRTQLYLQVSLVASLSSLSSTIINARRVLT